MNESFIIIALFISGCLATYLLTPLSIRGAHRFGVLDAPAKRKVHAQPIPRMGGTAIFGSLVIISLLSIPFIPRLSEGFGANAPFYVSIAFGAAMVFAVGLLDDIRNASIVSRLGIQALAASAVYWYGGVAIEQVGIPFLGQISLEWWVSFPLTVAWIVGVTNALNIIDGLDGLASGVSFIACAAVFVVAMMNDQFFAMASLALLAGCLLGFLRYNTHPAQIFLGDCGSLLLGFLLACISAGCSLKRSTSFALIIPMQILALPVYDTLYSMLRRIVREVIIEKNTSPRALAAMFKADRGHIHHSLLDLGFSQTRVVWLLYALSFVLGGLGLLSALFLRDNISLGFLILGTLCFLVMRNYGALRRAMSPPRAHPEHGE